MDKLIFVSKKLPNDPRISCKSFSSLAYFIESDFSLEKNLKKFEKTLKKDEVVELWILNHFPPKFPCILKYFLSEEKYFKK